MIIAVHDLRRNVSRAVRSVIQDADPTIRAFIVAHNLPVEDVRLALADLIDENPGRVRVEQLDDGIRSPSGPFNYGMRSSTADYVGIMGSDDELDPTAIREWRACAEARRADAVIAKVVRGANRGLVRSPAKRVWKFGALDFAKDRLSYRSAPLGLIRRDAVERFDLRLLEGAGNGGDLPFVTRLWALGRVVPSTGLGAYVEHADAPARVTWAAKPIDEEHGSIRWMLSGTFINSLRPSYRTALGTKLLRRNVMDSIRKRDGGRALTNEDMAGLRRSIQMILAYAPRSRWLVSRAHGAMIEELLRDAPRREVIVGWDEIAANPSHRDSLLPARLRFVLHRQAQPRYAAAAALIKVGSSRYLPAAVRATIALATTVVAIVAVLVVRSVSSG
ncbi:glycosyltransferase family A protein [Microbacterium paludicola]|uniref:glycosyltransferase family A protein n=1 Tax=Microbacterium paludicola TaxID=300019 RepID=UPI0021B644B6|nr:glycosyltransferase family A protein [Microbacterium paludicola]